MKQISNTNVRIGNCTICNRDHIYVRKAHLLSRPMVRLIIKLQLGVGYRREWLEKLTVKIWKYSWVWSCNYCMDKTDQRQDEMEKVLLKTSTVLKVK